MPICDRNHGAQVPERIADLDESQAGAGRHKCASCAYEKGYQDAVSGHAAPLNEEPLAPTPRPR